MDNALEGKAALVTGGSRGIGAAVALRLAREGADVAITYEHRSDKAADVVARIERLGRRAVAIRADAGDADALAGAVQQAADALGRLDVLVNNAGVGAIAPLDELGRDDLERTLAVNVRAPFVAAQAAARHMRDGGRIVSIGSCAAGRAPHEGYALYALSKTALIGLTKGLARDLGARGITANLVHPGPIDTDMNPADGPYADTNRGFTALGRYGEPEEVAATVAHLAGDEGRYITGASIAVDGGFTA